MSGSALEAIQTIIAEAVKYTEDAKSLWEELEASEGDKSFYQKFGKVASNPGILESIRDKMA